MTFDFGLLINIAIGILVTLVGGFFVLQLIITAIGMATEYSGNAEGLKKAQQTLSAGVKGIAVAIGTVLVLNFLLNILGVGGFEGGPVGFVVEKITNLEECLKNYEACE